MGAVAYANTTHIKDHRIHIVHGRNDAVCLPRAAHRGKAYSGGAGRGNRQAASAARADGVTGQRGG